jgi:hypothetical protein
MINYHVKIDDRLSNIESARVKTTRDTPIFLQVNIMIIMVLRCPGGTCGKCTRNPICLFFLNTFKYVSAHETITLINASIILKRKSRYSTFQCRPYSLFAAFCLPVLLHPETGEVKMLKISWNVAQWVTSRLDLNSGKILESFP